MRSADLARLVALAAIWGTSFVFLRVLAPVLGAAWTAESRVLIAGLTLAAWFRLTGFAPGWRRNAKVFVVVGLLNSALPFVLYGWAAQHLPAAVMAVVNACTPLSGAVCAAIWLGEPLTRTRLGGIGCGIAGVAWLSFSRPAGGPLPDPQLLPAIAACLLATLCYGLAGVYLKRCASAVAPLAIAGGSQLAAALWLLPLLPFAAPIGPLTGPVLASLLGLGLICSALAYGLYYRLIADLGPTRALTVTFLIPPFGVAWSALLLGEPLSPALAGSGVLIVAGTVLVLRGR